jgi:hypothetical protein
MAGKKRFSLNTEAIDAPSQASLLDQSGGKPPQSTWFWDEHLQPAWLKRMRPRAFFRVVPD